MRSKVRTNTTTAVNAKEIGTVRRAEHKAVWTKVRDFRRTL
ncbi:hypothetical protein AB0M50_46795 [Nonomuraea fuscirosea]|jgi:hypothetical protein|nr:hypothetical protein [Nonomuraea fuscirosea]WSA55697.1 hypothetical protein OIE67_14155 [Nonomuraea fuscirosea]